MAVRKTLSSKWVDFGLIFDPEAHQPRLMDIEKVEVYYDDSLLVYCKSRAGREKFASSESNFKRSWYVSKYPSRAVDLYVGGYIYWEGKIYHVSGIDADKSGRPVTVYLKDARNRDGDELIPAPGDRFDEECCRFAVRLKRWNLVDEDLPEFKADDEPQTGKRMAEAHMGSWAKRGFDWVREEWERSKAQNDRLREELDTAKRERDEALRKVSRLEARPVPQAPVEDVPKLKARIAELEDLVVKAAIDGKISREPSKHECERDAQQTQAIAQLIDNIVSLVAVVAVSAVVCYTFLSAYTG